MTANIQPVLHKLENYTSSTVKFVARKITPVLQTVLHLLVK